MEIISRAAWGARHDNGSGAAPLPADEAWLHHSVTASAGPDATFDQDAARIRDVEAVGESRFGTGISYTWPITQSGRVFEGHSPNRLGTHTGGRNSIARAICFVGNYDSQLPTPAQVRAAAWLLQYAKARGWIRHARLNGGHRDLKATACPGAHAYAVIGTINALAAGPPITNVESDMPGWDENLSFTNPETGAVSSYSAGAYLMYTNYYVNMIPALKATTAQILAAVTEGNLDPDEVLARVDTAVREATEKAMTEKVMPALQASADSILVGQTSKELVAQFMQDMADRLGQPMPQA